MPPLRILVAPDSFKGTFSAPTVAAAIGAGIERGGAQAELCPVADGGEGTVDVLLAVLSGRVVQVPAHDPLGRALTAPFGLLGPDETRALVETAAASGLALLGPEELDPWAASTYGTGELIVAAAHSGVREILVAVGGSATVDGGRGALEAIAAAGGLPGHSRLVVLSDVTTPWERCAEVYGPQKGANPELVTRLAARLDALADLLPRDPRGVPMTGGAGGLSGGLWSALDAELRAGAPYVLDVLDFDRRLRECAAVVTGEGRIDSQSLLGKVVGTIAGRAQAAGVPLHAIVGQARIDATTAASVGIRSVTEATDVSELEAAGEQLARSVLDAAAARTN